ncbi:MAG TPA: hypothetical protein VGK73_39175 [Polyangiaceae bacterium]
MVGGRSAWVLVFAAIVAACGSSSRPEEPGGGGSSSGARGGTGAAGGSVAGSGTSGAGGGAGTGGIAGSAAGTLGSSGGSAGASAGSSGAAGVGGREAEACLAYASAVCRRRATCDGGVNDEPYPCSQSCPDVVFSEGSTRTIENLTECAAAYETFSCEEIAAGRVPPCVTPGTKQVGEPCRFASQCESLACRWTDEDDGGCGTCVRPIEENGDCSGENTQCRHEQQACIAGICQPFEYYSKAEGEACSFAEECVGNACIDGVCAGYADLGEPCVKYCSGDLYCADPDRICRPLPGLNEPCARDIYYNFPRCSSGLACTATSDDGSGTCVEPVLLSPGASCATSAGRCPEGTTCGCTDRDCSDAICGVARLLGEPCGDGTNVFDRALDCAGGVCVAPDLRGEFASYCGP